MIFFCRHIMNTSRLYFIIEISKKNYFFVVGHLSYKFISGFIKTYSFVFRCSIFSWKCIHSILRGSAYPEIILLTIKSIVIFMIDFYIFCYFIFISQYKKMKKLISPLSINFSTPYSIFCLFAVNSVPIKLIYSFVVFIIDQSNKAFGNFNFFHFGKLKTRNQRGQATGIGFVSFYKLKYLCSNLDHLNYKYNKNILLI